MRTSRVAVFVVALALSVVPALAQTQTPIPGSELSLVIRNDTCAAGVQLSQIVWVRGEQIIGL
ncbi:MAG TPA: hypothetical protein ENN53_05535 [Candidatus Acetothermia bacterium]|nr:hypothetical protein [Candidatus Acetothermia bacterium]